MRWFTPGGEIDLCGHATLACAYALFRFYITDADEVVFSTLGGDLVVKRKGDLLEMEFPAHELRSAPVTKAMEEAIGAKPLEAYMGRDLLCAFDDEKTVRGLRPDMAKLLDLDGLLLQVTASGADVDSVPRSFARSSTSPRTRCADPAIATSPPIGPKSSAKRKSWHTRRRSGEGRCIAGCLAARCSSRGKPPCSRSAKSTSNRRRQRTSQQQTTDGTGEAMVIIKIMNEFPRGPVWTCDMETGIMTDDLPLVHDDPVVASLNEQIGELYNSYYGSTRTTWRAGSTRSARRPTSPACLSSCANSTHASRS